MPVSSDDHEQIKRAGMFLTHTPNLHYICQRRRENDCEKRLTECKLLDDPLQVTSMSLPPTS